MITIYKDKNINVVTKGAYEQVFKPLGYQIKTDKKVIDKKENKDNDKKIEEKSNKKSESKKTDENILDLE